MLATAGMLLGPAAFDHALEGACVTQTGEHYRVGEPVRDAVRELDPRSYLLGDVEQVSNRCLTVKGRGQISFCWCRRQGRSTGHRCRPHWG
jgi:hypothetical protein